MTEENLKITVLKYLKEGENLAQIQSLLQKEHNYNINYMQLRILSSEIEFSWQEDLKENDEVISSEDEVPLDEIDPVIEISRVAKPGVVVHGYFKFLQVKQVNGQ